MLILNYCDTDYNEKLSQFCKLEIYDSNISIRVSEILNEVRANGDDALLAFSKKFDHVNISKECIKIPQRQLDKSAESISVINKELIEKAKSSIDDYHKECLPQSWKKENNQGATVGEKYYPINRVGIYIPGGSVPLISTVIMTIPLAQLAGVNEIAVCTPPQKNGSVSSEILAAIQMCGVNEVYQVGGAQAIAALAFGTESIKPVDKIFGPGNAFVVEAKRQVFGEVGIDLLPGPSEIMVIADESARADFIAADLLAQAEHGSGKEKIYLVCSDNKLIDGVNIELNQQVKNLTHRETINSVIESGYLVIKTDTIDESIIVANSIAPEHLGLHVKEAFYETYVENITTAGAIMLGAYSPVVLGDFTAGPSHTLPTGCSGRFSSGLRITDFFRRSSIVQYDRESIKNAKPIVDMFSELEKLDAHGNSLNIRLDSN